MKKFIIFLSVVVGYFFLKEVGLFVVKKTIEHKFSQRVPVELRIGKLDYSLLRRSVSVSGVSISDEGIPIFDLHNATLSFEFLSLFKEQKVIRAVTLTSPHFTFYKEGKKHNLAKLLKIRSSQKIAKNKEGQRKPAGGNDFRIDDPRVSAPRIDDLVKKQARVSLQAVIHNIKVKNFKVSYVERFPELKFRYLVNNGMAEISEFTYPHLKKSRVKATMKLPNSAMSSIEGDLTSDKKGKEYSFEGLLKVDNASLVAFKDFMSHHYSISPKNGTVSLVSNISLRGTRLDSSNQATVENFDLEGEANVIGAVLGTSSSVILAFLNTTSGDKFNLKFHLRGDFKGGKTDWIAAIGEAVGEAFMNQINIFERSPAGKIKEMTDKVIDSIKGVIP